MSSWFEHLTYVGSEHPELNNKKALVRGYIGPVGMVLAQFDDMSLQSKTILETRTEIIEGRPTYDTPVYYLRWGYGWHELPAEDFKQNGAEVLVRITNPHTVNSWVRSKFMIKIREMETFPEETTGAIWLRNCYTGVWVGFEAAGLMALNDRSLFDGWLTNEEYEAVFHHA